MVEEVQIYRRVHERQSILSIAAHPTALINNSFFFVEVKLVILCNSKPETIS